MTDERITKWREKNRDKYNEYHKNYRKKSEKAHNDALEASRRWKANKRAEFLAMPVEYIKDNLDEAKKLRCYKEALKKVLG